MWRRVRVVRSCGGWGGDAEGGGGGFEGVGGDVVVVEV